MLDVFPPLQLSNHIPDFQKYPSLSPKFPAFTLAKLPHQPTNPIGGLEDDIEEHPRAGVLPPPLLRPNFPEEKVAKEEVDEEDVQDDIWIRAVQHPVQHRGVRRVLTEVEELEFH